MTLSVKDSSGNAQAVRTLDDGIGGITAHVSAVPTVTATTYASGKCIGGLLTLSGALRVAGKSALLQSVTLRAKVSLTSQVDLIIFRDTPTVTAGLVDNATFAVDVTEFDKVTKVVSFTSYTNLGTPSVSNVDGIGKLMSAASGVDFKAILVARGPVTLTSSSDLSIGAAFAQD